MLNRTGPFTSGRTLIVALAVFYLVVVYGGAALKADYSHVSQYISELNASGTAWSWQIGYLGFLPLGLLGFLVLLVVAPRAGLSDVSRIGCWLLIAEPIAYLGSAFAPCDLGCPSTGSLSQNVHNIVSVVTLGMTTIGLVLLSRNDRLTPTQRVGWLALAATFIALYTAALLPGADEVRGLLQRMAEGVLYGCLCVVGWRVLAHHESTTEPTR